MHYQLRTIFPKEITIAKRVVDTEKSEISDIGEAEYNWLRKEWSSRDVYYHTEGEHIPSPFIIRMANIISQTTRRGAGNRLVLHPDNYHLLDPSVIDANGSFANAINIFVSENCPKNKMVVFYSGKSFCDNPCHIHDFQDRMFFTEMENLADFHIKQAHYVQQLPLIGI